MKLKPHEDTATEDMDHWILLTNEQKWKIGALIFALHRMATTTVLYSYNITGHNLNEIKQSSRAIGIPSSSRYVIDDLLNKTYHRQGKNPLIFQAAMSLIQDCCGACPDTTIICGEYWNPGVPYEAITSACGPYLDAMDRPPQSPSVLCVDDWLKLRPLEWGITAPYPKVNVKAIPIRLRGHCQLPEDYDSSVWPGCALLAWDAPAIVNIATQNWRHTNGRWPDLVYRNKKREIVLRQHSEYLNLGTFKPCTIMTYDYISNSVLEPFLQADGREDAFQEFLQTLEHSTLNTGWCSKYQSNENPSFIE